MKALAVSVLCVCVCSTVCGQPRPRGESAAMILEHVTVIDSTGAPPRTNMSLLITGDRI
jgi:hypothetical protein